MTIKFHIGSILGGPEVSETPVDVIISRVARASHAYQQAHEIASEGGLDIVYHVPGSIMQPEFEGLRTGKFSKKEKMLMVQISVPILFQSGQHQERILVEALREAIQLADPIFKRANIPFLKEEYFQLVDSLSSGNGTSPLGTVLD